jgi:dTDP-4-amino-4,6-dideoxygalactose transaminase
VTQIAPIPFFDLTRQYQSLEPEVMAALLPVLKSQHFILGPAVSDFEATFSRKFSVGHSIGVSSGTDALLLSLLASGLQKGEGVLVPSFTFFASASAITLGGGTPVFTDVDRDSYLLTPEILEHFLRERTAPDARGVPVLLPDGVRLSGIVAVHLYGQMLDMEGLSSVAKSFGLWIVEDACQAIGATHRGHSPGIFSNAAAYSFFPTKNLGGFGDGGMVTTESTSFAEHIERLRVHGSRKRYEHLEIGYNARLDAIQAKVLSVKIGHLDRWNKRRQQLAERYTAAFCHLNGVGLPVALPGRRHVFHQFTMRVEGETRRDRLRADLSEKGIGSEVYYPIPLHRQPAFAEILERSGPLSVSDQLSREVISLPIFPELSDSEQERIIEAVHEFLG